MQPVSEESKSCLSRSLIQLSMLNQQYSQHYGISMSPYSKPPKQIDKNLLETAIARRIMIEKIIGYIFSKTTGVTKFARWIYLLPRLVVQRVGGLCAPQSRWIIRGISRTMKNILCRSHSA